MKTKPTYSIIIPHYNTPDLLERLLLSIPKRDDVEVIIVDDCSPDSAFLQYEILKAKYEWMKFYSTEINGGGGKARNIGLQKAIGEYVIFADADDYFTPQFKDILKNYADTTTPDIIFFNAISVDSVTQLPKDRSNHLNNFIQGFKTNPSQKGMELRYLFGEPWCKIIKKDLIENNKILFDEISINNDTYFSYMCGFYSKNIAVDERIGYCITERPTSVSKSISYDKLLIKAKVFAKKNKFLKENGITIFDPNLFVPPIYGIRKRNFKFLRQIKSIINSYGFSFLSLLFQYLKYRFLR